MSEMTEITVALPVFLLEDAEEMIDETGFHDGVDDFVTDAIRDLLIAVLQGYKGEFSTGVDSYINLRENFPNSRRITLSIPQGLANTVNSYLEKSSRSHNMFVGVTIDRSVVN